MDSTAEERLAAARQEMEQAQARFHRVALELVAVNNLTKKKRD
jgi:hypothetical protein